MSNFDCSISSICDISNDGQTIFGVLTSENTNIVSESLHSKELIVFQKAHGFMISMIKYIEEHNAVLSGSFLSSFAHHQASTGNLLKIIPSNLFSPFSISVFDHLAFIGFSDYLAVYDIEKQTFFSSAEPILSRNIIVNHLYRDPQEGEGKGNKLVIGACHVSALKMFNVDDFFQDLPQIEQNFYVRGWPQIEADPEMGHSDIDEEIDLDISDFEIDDDEDILESKKPKEEAVKKDTSTEDMNHFSRKKTMYLYGIYDLIDLLNKNCFDKYQELLSIVVSIVIDNLLKAFATKKNIVQLSKEEFEKDLKKLGKKHYTVLIKRTGFL